MLCKLARLSGSEGLHKVGIFKFDGKKNEMSNWQHVI
jgi:hypothetical protein